MMAIVAKGDALSKDDLQKVFDSEWRCYGCIGAAAGPVHLRAQLAMCTGQLHMPCSASNHRPGRPMGFHATFVAFAPPSNPALALAASLAAWLPNSCLAVVRCTFPQAPTLTRTTGPHTHPHHRPPHSPAPQAPTLTRTTPSSHPHRHRGCGRRDLHRGWHHCCPPG